MYIQSVRPIMFCMEPSVEVFNTVKNDSSIDTIHLYVDVKNSSTALFIPDAVQDLIESGKRLRTGMESSIFQSIVLTASNWINAAKANNLNVKIFFCNDKGTSKYHKAINPNYKSNRVITNTLLEHYSEELQQTKTRNWDLAERVCNKLNDIYFLNLNFVESDFIPYYLITRHYQENSNILHVVSSNDKDHYQILNIPNTVMFSKRAGVTTILDKKSYLTKFIKLNNIKVEKQSYWIDLINKVDPNYINVLMSFCGDKSDNVFGLHGIGEKTALKMFADEEVVKALLGPPEEIPDRVMNGEFLLKDNEYPMSKLSKQWVNAIQNNNIVTNAFKQIDYECLCKWLEKKDTTVKIDNLKYLEEKVTRPLVDFDERSKQEFIQNVMQLEDCCLDYEQLESLF